MTFPGNLVSTKVKNSMQSLFRSGDVLVNTGLDRPVVLWDVPGADLVQATLHDLMEADATLIAQRRRLDQSTHGEHGADGTRPPVRG